MGAEGEARAAILVVAGDLNSRDALVEVLEGYGYEAAAASAGGEALDYLEVRRPCLILLDVPSPSGASYELLTSLKADSRLARLPVVLLTGTAEAGAFRHFPGAVLCLSRPVEASTLLKVVGVYCRQLTPAVVVPDLA